jgi:uncharacterized Rossmann fold enzyme
MENLEKHVPKFSKVIGTTQVMPMETYIILGVY